MAGRWSISAALATILALASDAQSQGTCHDSGVFQTYCLGSVCLAPWGSNAFTDVAQSVYEQLCKNGLAQCPGEGPCGDTIGDASRCCDEADWNLCFACYRNQTCHNAVPTISFSLLPFQDPTGPVIIPQASCTFGQMDSPVVMTDSSSTSSTTEMAPAMTPTESSATMSEPAATQKSTPASAGPTSSEPTASEPTSSAPVAGDTPVESPAQSSSTGAAAIAAEQPHATAIGLMLAALGVGML